MTKMSKASASKAKRAAAATPLNIRIPAPEVGAGWTKVVKAKPDGTTYCRQFYSPCAKGESLGAPYRARIYAIKRCDYLEQCAKGDAARRRGEEEPWLSTLN